MPMSCCAKVTNQTRLNVNVTTYTNSSVTYACLPIDFITNVKLWNITALNSFIYECPTSTTAFSSSQGGLASDLCPNGPADPCSALIPYACCSQ